MGPTTLIGPVDGVLKVISKMSWRCIEAMASIWVRVEINPKIVFVTINCIYSENLGRLCLFVSEITLTKELCAQPLRLVWLIVYTKTELEKDIKNRCITNLSIFKDFTFDNRS